MIRARKLNCALTMAFPFLATGISKRAAAAPNLPSHPQHSTNAGVDTTRQNSPWRPTLPSWNGSCQTSSDELSRRFPFEEDREERIERSLSRNNVTSRLFRASLPRRAFLNLFFRAELAFPSPQKEACEKLTNRRSAVPPKSKPGLPPPHAQKKTKALVLPNRTFDQTFQPSFPDFSPVSPSWHQRFPMSSNQHWNVPRKSSRVKRKCATFPVPTDLKNHPGTTDISTSHLLGAPTPASAQTKRTRTNERTNERTDEPAPFM